MSRDELSAAIEAFGAIPRESPSARRPSRAVVARLLAANGSHVTVRNSEVLEDVDGIPLGVVTSVSTATLCVSLDALGWTEHEWNNPTITK